jgi:iturin family lipopeptide synthetase A
MRPKKLLSLLKDYKVGILQLVPSYINIIVDYLDNHDIELNSLEMLISTGEELKYDLARKVLKCFDGVSLVNAYGPTEASDDVTHYKISLDKLENPIPIGYEIRNTKLSIVDSELNILPDGEKGEILISGLCLGDGYIFEPEQTHKSFIDSTKISGGKGYLTGDIGTSKDGLFYFYGRKDSQIKLNGNRIELGEIERYIENVVPENRFIVLFDQDSNEIIVCGENMTKQMKTILQTNLATLLPSYMLPNLYVEVVIFPLSANGKIDKKKLMSNYKEGLCKIQ